MEHKNLNFEIKAHEDGSFVGYGSTFGNVDLVGDIVQKGAFTKSLAKTGASGVKMFLQHNPNDIIGEYTKIYEDEKGLVIEGTLYLGDIQKANETHFLMKKRQITQFSIGYSIPQGGKSFDSQGNTKLNVIDLHEISPVTYACNTEAELVGVKAIKGSNLVAILNDKIEDMTDGGESRADIVGRMASAAGITTDTVNAILNREINQPPMNRLRAFARVLGVSVARLERAAEDDSGQSPKRSEDHGKTAIRELERKLRDVGYSQKEAKAICAVGYKGLRHRDDVLGNEDKEADEAIFINLMTGKL